MFVNLHFLQQFQIQIILEIYKLPDLSYDPYNEEGERDTSISTSTTFLNEKIMNAYNYCIQAIDVMIFACNALANYCVLAMYNPNHIACSLYNEIFNKANDISQLELDAYNDYL